MKKIMALFLCLVMILGLFSGCAAEDTPYVPHGDALMAEDADLNTPIAEEKEPQELTMVCYMDKPLNPYKSSD